MDSAVQIQAETIAARRGAEGGERLQRLLREIDALIEGDEAADRKVTGAWQTFDDIVAAAHVHAWDAYSVDLTADAESFRVLDPRPQEAVRRVFGTIYRAESVVDDWMAKIVAAVPREPGYESMRAALMTQAHDERMHRGSLLRIGEEVLDIPPEEADRVARKYNTSSPRSSSTTSSASCASTSGRTGRSPICTPRSSSTA